MKWDWSGWEYPIAGNTVSRPRRGVAPAVGGTDASGIACRSGSGPVPGLERECVAQLVVARIADRVEERERVPPARGEDRDEHAAAGARGHRRARDAPRRACAAPSAAGAVDGQGRTEGAREELAAVEARACGLRHARLDRREPVAGFGHGAAQHGDAGELVAVVQPGSRRLHLRRDGDEVAERVQGHGREAPLAVVVGDGGAHRLRGVRERGSFGSGRSPRTPQNYDRAVDELLRIGRHLAAPRVLGVVGVLLQHARGHVPAGVECRGVEPAVVVPAATRWAGRRGAGRPGSRARPSPRSRCGRRACAASRRGRRPAASPCAALRTGAGA